MSEVTKAYGFVYALKKVDLEISEGETIGILGNNGAGKSTLLKIISLLVKPTSGKVELFGTEVKEDRYLYKKEIGTLLSHSFFYDDMTGRENLEFYLKMSGRTDSPVNTVAKAIKEYKLRLYIDRPVNELSTGMTKKLELLRAVLPSHPKLLLLDEPFSGLDVENKQFLGQLITDRPSKATVIICSHDFEAIARVCNKVFFLEKGEITRILTPPEYNFFLERIDKKERHV
ncbi:MAG: ABC transporter ATP-binding protein [Promethearchaeota archaeon]